MTDDRLKTLTGTLDLVWDRLRDGVADRHAPARHPVLATRARDGGAAARIVVLRGADRGGARLEIHTDSASAKVTELRADPRAAILVWDAGLSFQIRIATEITLRQGEEAAAAWSRVPDQAHANYGGTPKPGTPVDDPGQVRPDPDPARFALLECRVTRIETLHLGPDMHRRAQFDETDGWRGVWIAP